MCSGTYPYLMMRGSLLESNNNYQSKSESQSSLGTQLFFVCRICCEEFCQ